MKEMMSQAHLIRPQLKMCRIWLGREVEYGIRGACRGADKAYPGWSMKVEPAKTGVARLGCQMWALGYTRRVEEGLWQERSGEFTGLIPGKKCAVSGWAESLEHGWEEPGGGDLYPRVERSPTLCICFLQSKKHCQVKNHHHPMLPMVNPTVSKEPQNGAVIQTET